jgi:hypothetical protein
VTGRLNAGHLIAFVAAAALLFFTAMDWYSTKGGEAARQIQESSEPAEGQPNRLSELNEEAERAAEAAEKNAWEPEEGIDVAILILVVSAAVLAMISVVLAAAGRPSGWTSAISLGAASLGAVLLTYRMLQEPGLDEVTTVEPGAPLALIALGVLALGGSLMLREEPTPDAEPDPSPPSVRTP